MMRYFVLMIFLFLAGCSPLDAVSRTIDTANRLGIDYDTNSYHSSGKRNDNIKYCEVKTGPNSTAWKPCK